ncbi:NAD(P)/FAD-dependent oxidoreductase [Xanthobacter oligotrophicus]|uniref:NAD(P)/FAD-dependent oxidoreductase n=1 Tax=Xanthobacter oligotrophicus TaxID=2607286 RepID=UPI0011F2C481|nr:FAD-dependent oxidoreductase [Xanthobacter oligotrophicus]MCG5238117.1 FAD-dependent oxidoreductase [Xanthobacter oligotrophicus]
MEQEHIAIVGAGQAAASLAMHLRHSGYSGALTLYGDEPHPPYQRPPLSKAYLKREWTVDRLYLRPADFWSGLGVALVTDARVTAIDPAGRTLEVNDRTVPWSKLALATGTRPRTLPPEFSGLEGVYELRGLADAERLQDAIRPGRRLMVLGGGYVGLETAAVAVKTGLSVTVVERAARILERVACPETSDAIRALHAGHGVRILEGRSVAAVAARDGAVAVVTLDDGTRMEVDAVLVGIGVLPRDELARAAGIACDNGIAVDVHGRTSAPGIWAAGDCAAFPLAGIPTRLESVQNAVDQAECAADDMLGRPRVYAPVPWFWSDQYDMKLQIVGLNRGYDAVLRRRSERGESLWYFREGRMIAVDALNDARTYMAAKKLLEGGIAVSLEEAAQEGFDPVARMRRPAA